MQTHVLKAAVVQAQALLEIELMQGQALLEIALMQAQVLKVAVVQGQAP